MSNYPEGVRRGGRMDAGARKGRGTLEEKAERPYPEAVPRPDRMRRTSPHDIPPHDHISQSISPHVVPGGDRIDLFSMVGS